MDAQDTQTAVVFFGTVGLALYLYHLPYITYKVSQIYNRIIGFIGQKIHRKHL